MRKLPNLNAIVYFEAVARHSRVNQAAEELMVSPSAVSQQIKSIEESLGVRLFRRLKRRLILTEEGERFYASATKSLNILREAQNQVSRKRQVRRLHIRTSATFGVRWLSPRLTQFINQNPEWELHVDATSEITDFEKENIDLEIRYGGEPPIGLHSLLLIHDRTLPMCSPEFLEINRGRDPADVLDNGRLIHTVKANVGWQWWLDKNGFHKVGGGSNLKFDRSSMALQAAKDSLGIVLETATLAMDDLRLRKLVPFVPQYGTVKFPAYHFICPARHLNRRAVKTFADWILLTAQKHELEKEELLVSLKCDAIQNFPLSQSD